MDLITNLQGRLKNTALPQTRTGLLPVFESISNAIHAIEDAGLAMTRGSITLEVIRSSQASFDYEQEPESRVSAPIVGFKIVDNGTWRVGFNEDNMKSFLTLDSQYKAPRGGRGVGRLLWLKAFARARIRTTFLENGETPKLREFTFSLHDGVAKSDSTQRILQMKEQGRVSVWSPSMKAIACIRPRQPELSQIPFLHIVFGILYVPVALLESSLSMAMNVSVWTAFTNNT